MHTESIKDQTIGTLVADDYRMAAIFRKHGIDFCCGGGKTVTEACTQKGIDATDLERELKQATTGKPEQDVDEINSWPMSRVIDHILTNHHVYVRETLPLLIGYTRKVARVHGEANPEVREIAGLVELLAKDLEQHMVKEELILFPYVRALESQEKMLPLPTFQTVRNPIRMMQAEHDAAGEIMKKIRALSHDYNPPDHACNTYKVAYHQLREFEDDLFRHVHLENNILFPKALEREAEVL